MLDRPPPQQPAPWGQDFPLPEWSDSDHSLRISTAADPTESYYSLYEHPGVIDSDVAVTPEGTEHANWPEYVSNLDEDLRYNSEDTDSVSSSIFEEDQQFEVDEHRIIEDPLQEQNQWEPLHPSPQQSESFDEEVQHESVDVTQAEEIASEEANLCDSPAINSVDPVELYGDHAEHVEGLISEPGLNPDPATSGTPIIQQASQAVLTVLQTLFGAG